MKVHFIAIGGSAMHNLAIALHKKGYFVTGSDDEIFEPSRTRLKNLGLLPATTGWSPEKITSDLDAVILGMHAREDNPELIKAKELNLKIFSYPEYLYEQTKNKKRIIIGGSHGKTTITSMIIHVLNKCGIAHDYMVGAQLEGFDAMVNLSDNSQLAVFEGDEYLSSPIDRRPKFHLYKPHIALISGIAWDHINVFPTFDIYVEQFRIFAEMTDNDGALIYCGNDPELCKVAEQAQTKARKIKYTTHSHIIRDGKTFLKNENTEIQLEIFGEHNLQNISGALNVCLQIGVSAQDFYTAISTFKGASKRLQLLESSENTSVYLDFAHSPSKLKATTTAVKEQYPERKLIACMELHTFSSLNDAFLDQYSGSMNQADSAFVFFNPETIKHKRLENISPERVKMAFGGNNITVFTETDALKKSLLSINWKNKTLLLMSSGNFSGIDYKTFAKEIIHTNN